MSENRRANGEEGEELDNSGGCNKKKGHWDCSRIFEDFLLFKTFCQNKLKNSQECREKEKMQKITLEEEEIGGPKGRDCRLTPKKCPIKNGPKREWEEGGGAAGPIGAAGKRPKGIGKKEGERGLVYGQGKMDEKNGMVLAKIWREIQIKHQQKNNIKKGITPNTMHILGRSPLSNASASSSSSSSSSVCSLSL
jgi:hypothetical protein